MDKAFLFDLDGTLLDSAPELAFCLNQLLQQQGKPHISLEKVRATISFGVSGILSCAFERTHPQFSHLKQRFLEMYAHHLGTQTTYFAGVVPFIEWIKQQNYPWGIVTNKPQAYTLPLLKKFPVLNTTCIVAGDTLSVSKPHPEPLLHACRQLNVSPLECWYIGDAKTDVEASRQAGMRCAIVHYGYFSKNEDIFAWQADRYLHQLIDLAEK